MFLPDVGVFLLLCVILWIGTGLIVSSVDRFAHKLRLSAFSLSFFVLGLLTSLPEIAVATNALGENTPEVFVGNLLGGIPVLFLFVIPLLAIFGGGVKVNHELTPMKIFLTFAVISAPALFVLDRSVNNLEGIVMIGLYLSLFFLLEGNKGGVLRALKNGNRKTMRSAHAGVITFKILVGIFLVFGAGHFLIEKTLYFASVIGILPFYVSLILLSLGTNIPELSLAVRSVIQGKKDIALGDYMGSAAANTLIFGIFTLLTPAESFAVNHSYLTFTFIVGGLVLFYYFYRSKRDISRREGGILLAMYLLFSFLELSR